MHVDAHQHFWRYDPAEYAWIDASMRALQRHFLPADLEPELRGAGMQASIAVQVRQSVEESDWLLRLADEHPFVAGVVGWVDLQSDRVEETLARLTRHPKFVGVRHIVQAEADDRFMLRPSFLRGIRALRQFGLPYDILIYPRHLPAACELAERCGGQPFVLDHLAKPEIARGAIDAWQRDLARLAASPDVVCKVSGLVTEAHWDRWTAQDVRPYLDAAFEAFGPGRMIAGSDWPVCTLAASYGRTMELVRSYLQGWPAEVRAAVLGGNAMRVWRLPAGQTAAPAAVQEHT